MPTVETMRDVQLEASENRFHEIMKTPRPKREGFLYTDSVNKSGAKVKCTIRTPHDPISEQPVLVVGGFQGIKPVYGDFRDMLSYYLRRPVASFRRPRAESLPWLSLMPDKVLHPAKIGPQSVVAMIDMLHGRFGELVTVVGHSMGGPNAVDAALRRVDKVNHVILMGSGGLEENHNPTKFIKRGPAIMRDEVLPAVPELANRESPMDSLKIAYESLHYTFRHPWRTAGEALDVGSRPLMRRELHELNSAGIMTSAVQFDGDRFFPLDEATRHTPGLVDGYHVMPDTNHMAPITRPEQTAHFVGDIIAGRTVQLAA